MSKPHTYEAGQEDADPEWRPMVVAENFGGLVLQFKKGEQVKAKRNRTSAHYAVQGENGKTIVHVPARYLAEATE
jgi:hypothetical protein